MAPCRNVPQAVLLQHPLVSAKTQSPSKDDSSSFQKVKEDLVPSDQSKLRPFCGRKRSHHFLAKTAAWPSPSDVWASLTPHTDLHFHILDFYFRGSRTACEYGLTRKNICLKRCLLSLWGILGSLQP